ncbi:MAG TPA: cytochrome c biogenesis protein CcsA [Puia sp.]|nr:cytochrome c biogenesis protein CcsA [Puia sp.]
MDYLGEHLLPGRIGHFFATVSFAASFIATVAYYKSASSKSVDDERAWRRLGRITFTIDGLALMGVFAVIYYIIRAHYFEYNFAWEHSSKTLDLKYLLSCVWSAQEGSFLLWMLWHFVLGIVLIFTSKKWESPVMSVLSFAQLCLATMIVGLYFWGAKIGINPFMLIRHTELFDAAPFLHEASTGMLKHDYLTYIKDGQGLTPLLQNYWMVIHPPILFLGFASTIVPFAFAFAGLWKKQYGDWVKVALPWTLFSTCILGTGIMMGAAWAYESLSFGGYWAWDPVENASLVPWLVYLAGLHTMVIFNATGHSLRATYLFIFLGFILILYSTFLTRSGILGDTSVHSFVDSGMNFQLIALITVFLVPAFGLLFWRYKSIPHIRKEENINSREFWMFIGSLVLFLSAAFVIAATSLPVPNKLFGTNLTIGDDATFAYNRIEIFIAVIVGVLTAVGQYLKYKMTSTRNLMKVVPPTLIAVILSVAISILGNIHYDRYGNGFLAAIHLAVFCAMYAVVANAMYIWSAIRGNLRNAGGSIAHVGFGLMMIGILLSSSKKEVLSYNTTGININFLPSAKQNPMENITLIKNLRTDMGKYWATFINNDSVDSRNRTTYFHVRLQKKKNQDEFDLYPNMVNTGKSPDDNVFNPDMHHYWDKDIFSYISAAYNPQQENQEDTAAFRQYTIGINDTIYYSKGYIILDGITPNPNNTRYHFSPDDTALMANMTIIDKDSMRFKANPAFYVKNNRIVPLIDTVFAQDLAISFNGVGSEKKLIFGVKESAAMVPFVALKVLLFPQINILWLGTFIMIAGFAISVFRRVKLI